MGSLLSYMRRPHPRIRKATKWSSTVFALILVAAWGVSEYRIFGFAQTRMCVNLCSGYVRIFYSPQEEYFLGPPRPLWGWDTVNRTFQPRHWWFYWVGQPVYPFSEILIPFWMPLSICLLLSGATWRLDILACRRNQSQLCMNCSYNLTGLRPGSNCPECNTTPPKIDECKKS